MMRRYVQSIESLPARWGTPRPLGWHVRSERCDFTASFHGRMGP